MEFSQGHKHKHLELTCGSVSKLSSLLSPSSLESSLQSGGFVARFSSDSDGPQLGFRHANDSAGSDVAHVDLLSAQVSSEEEEEDYVCGVVWN